MIVLPKHKMTADEFFAWAEQQPREAGRFELWDGEVIVKRGPSGQQNAERSQHWEAKLAVAVALRSAIKRAKLPCFVALDGASVRLAGSRTAEPDVLVYCGQKVPRDVLVVPNPMIIVEVLSPSAAKHDMGAKLAAYFELASVEHVILIDPDRPLVIHHKRGAAETLETRIGAATPLRLDPPGLDVDLAELFEAGPDATAG